MKKITGALTALLICSTCSLPLPSYSAENRSKFSSTFIQSWYCGEWSQERWDQEFSSAKSAGFDSMIIQSLYNISMFYGNLFVAGEMPVSYTAYFPTKHTDEKDFTCYENTLLYALKAAKENDMKLWLGTVEDNQWWNCWNTASPSGDNPWIKKNAELSADIINEIWQLYGEEYGEQIAGWYYPNEIWNFLYACNGQDNGAYADIIAENINSSITAINSNCPEKPLMISPFYNTDLSTPQEYTAFLSDLLDSADFRPIDIYAGQNGGTKGYSPKVIREWAQAQKKAVDGHMHFWINNESLDPDMTSKPLDELSANYYAAAEFAEENIMFSWSHYYAGKSELNSRFKEFTFGNVPGDINEDGAFNSADLVRLQRWLLDAPDTRIVNGENADMCKDGILDVLDLCVMRKMLLKDITEEGMIVTNEEELYKAVENAKAGDIIKIAPGTYNCSKKITSDSDGTESKPITLKALASDDPPVLKGTTTENGYVLHILGDYWVLDGLICTNSQKGIVLDNSNHTVIRNCELHTLGSEAVAIRDGSSYCTVDSCNIHNTGLVSPGYGEGVYIGSAKSTTGFDYKCDHNKVIDCTFRNVAAEHIDVKEYTTDTEISGCTFYGDGMTGQNYAGSFIDIKGNNCYVHDNVGHRNNNPEIVAAFEIHEQAEGWGYHHVFERNKLFLDRFYGEKDTSRPIYIVDGWFSDFTVINNMVSYGRDLEMAYDPQYYNSDQVTFEYQ